MFFHLKSDLFSIIWWHQHLMHFIFPFERFLYQFCPFLAFAILFSVGRLVYLPPRHTGLEALEYLAHLQSHPYWDWANLSHFLKYFKSLSWKGWVLKQVTCVPLSGCFCEMCHPFSKSELNWEKLLTGFFSKQELPRSTKTNLW